MNKKELKKEIEKLYHKRTKAHNELLECDILLDNLFRSLIK